MCNNTIICSNLTTGTNEVVLIPNQTIKTVTNLGNYRLILACNIPEATANYPVAIQVGENNIPVLCYGLRCDFKMNSFPGSRRLLEIADELEELPTLCRCGKVARFVGRKVGDNYVQDGEEIVIDGTHNILYVPLCGNCYLEKVRGLDLKEINKQMKGE